MSDRDQSQLKRPPLMSHLIGLPQRSEAEEIAEAIRAVDENRSPAERMWRQMIGAR
jgi:hypothetical protein